MKIEIVLSPSFGCYDIQGKLLELMDKKGYEGFILDARIDKDIIKLVKKYEGKLNDIDWQYLSVGKVDTSRPWIIDEYDGAEEIKYLDEYKISNKELNYYELR